jgi:hypothetical protein
MVPLVSAFLLGSLYGPAVQALNPGNAIMTASDQTFQSDTFSLMGSIGSLIRSDAATAIADNDSGGSANDTGTVVSVVTGAWALDVQEGNVTGFLADMSMINTDGSSYQTIQLSNLTSSSVEMLQNGTARITGTVSVAVNGTAPGTTDPITISVAKLRAITIEIGGPANSTGVFAGQPLYGIVDQPELQAASLLPTEEETGEGPSGLLPENFTNKFQLPQLPNPFRQ